MAKDIRDSLIWWAVLFGIAFAYCCAQYVAHHVPLTLINFGGTVCKGFPLVGLALAQPRIIQCGWREPKARENSFRLAALLLTCFMGLGGLLLFSLWVQHRTDTAPVIVGLAGSGVLFVALQGAAWHASQQKNVVLAKGKAVVQEADPVAQTYIAEARQPADVATVRVGINR